MERTYENDRIRVFWDSSRCIHTGLCLQAEGDAFDVHRRPWVDLDEATLEQVVVAIEGCPSGALRYERLDDGPQEEPEDPTSVVPFPNGPLLVRGSIEIRDRRGDVFDTGPRFALCRCGESRNHPFCDLSHQDAGFRNHPRAKSARRAAAQSPEDVSDSTLD